MERALPPPPNIKYSPENVPLYKGRTIDVMSNDKNFNVLSDAFSPMFPVCYPLSGLAE